MRYELKAFNQLVKRNIEIFPEDFRFQISREELDALVRSQIVTSRDELFPSHHQLKKKDIERIMGDMERLKPETVR